MLTRLGNLLVREHRPERAVDVYARVLDMDPALENVWFNKAHAQIATGARASPIYPCIYIPYLYPLSIFHIRRTRRSPRVREPCLLIPYLSLYRSPVSPHI